MAPDAARRPQPINAVLHMWAFLHAHFDPEVMVSDVLELGLFDPVGIEPIMGAWDPEV